MRARWLWFTALLVLVGTPALAQVRGDNGATDVKCVSGCAGGTSDTDDDTVAGGQVTGINIAESYYWNTASGAWKRVTFGFTGTSLNVNCTGGCGAAASFADNSAFTFSTTPVNNDGFVVDDVATNAVAENSAGAARMSTSRILFTDVSKSASNTNSFKVDFGGSAQPVTISSGTVTAVTTITNPVTVTDGAGALNVICDSGCSGGTTDTDDASIATGQTTGITLPLTQVYDGSVWRRMTFGTAGTASAQVWTVQGIASMTALKVDGSGVTQPVSGTVTTSPPANASENLAQVAGTATSVNSGVKDAGTLRVVLATDQPALTNKLLVTPDSVALPANQSVNVNQLAGTTTDTNSGAKSAGTLRVVLATDQPALTNKLLVTPDSVALPANQSVNVNQFGGAAVVTGAGAGGAGIPRMTVSNDSTVGLVAGTALVGKVGVDQTTPGTTNGVYVNNVPHIVCDSGCGSPPATADGTAFTFGTTNVSPTAYVVDDVATNTIAENSYGAPRMSGSRVLYADLSQSAANSQLTAIEGDLRGVNAGNDTTLLAILRTLIKNAANPSSAVNLRGSFGRAVGSTGDALDVNVKYPMAAADPCQGMKQNAAISQTANARVVVAQPGRIYVCYMTIVGSDAENISIVEGTGTTCGTATAAVVGATTAANGQNFAANGGRDAGNGQGTIAVTATPGTDLCVFQSGAGRVAGNLTFAVR